MQQFCLPLLPKDLESGKLSSYISDVEIQRFWTNVGLIVQWMLIEKITYTGCGSHVGSSDCSTGSQNHCLVGQLGLLGIPCKSFGTTLVSRAVGLSYTQ